MILRVFSICSIIFSLVISTSAQENFPVNGVPDNYGEAYLLKNATIHPGNGLAQRVGDILIRDAKIVNVQPGLETDDAIVIELEGMHIYPSFIDLYAQYGIAELKKPAPYTEQFLSDKPGAYSWNESLRSEFRAHQDFVVDAGAAKSWRQAGFGTVLSHRMDGICRGSGVLAWVADGNEHEMISRDIAAHHLSLMRGSGNQDYPSSQMGSIALLRQAYYDGQWYAKDHSDLNISLASWNELLNLPTIIEASDHLTMLRVDRIGDEFGQQYIIKGSGKEYRRLDAIKATGASLIIPVVFPDAYDVEDPWAAEYVSLEEMKHWELAPYNLNMLHEQGIVFTITSDGLQDRNQFVSQVKKAVEKGLPHDIAVKALTETPAKLLGVFDEFGSIEAGKWANLIIADKPVFSKDAMILQNWVKGIPYQLENFPGENEDGEYNLNIDGKDYKLWLSNTSDKGAITMKLNDTTDINGDFIISDDGQITATYAVPDGFDHAGYTTLSGWKGSDGFQGNGFLPNGKSTTWKLTKTGSLENDEEQQDEDQPGEEIGPVIYPFVSYGWEDKPLAQKTLFKNATVWTNEEEGILEKADVLIEAGKIILVAEKIAPKGAMVIDAAGMHLTSGIIDEHSHICIAGGVNEGTKASSAEVSIGDVINSEQVNMYRQLAGGTTAAQLLHGSANPIGGQSALVKFRWGSLPEEMKIEGADGFIKFALGENVKRSSYTSSHNRFPQTRMGVEQVFVDHFTRAKEYHARSGDKRRDLELDVIAEILNGERFISCHSYVQSEINMIMKVAESFDFRIKIFTHILEGYKVADKMKEHGVGASTFSDWWGYKYEVIDAVPHNAALLNEMGVVTAINSDDAEMGRRLNQEAAKAVKYGGASEEDAWKMVTLNPAILLNLDDQMGSIKAGKDADLVLWSDNPLSIYAVVQQTYVDGVKYFDLKEDAEKRAAIDAERARLIQKMLVAKKGGAKVMTPQPQDEHYYHCDDLEDWAGTKE